MVGADDQAVVRAGHRVLGDHALPGLDVAVYEVLVVGVAEVHAGGQRCLERGSARGLDVHGQHVVGPDEGERELGVVPVGLDAVGQPHRVEPRLVSGGLGPIDGVPAHPAGGGGVHAAAEAEHKGAQTGGGQPLREESHPAFDLLLGLEGLGDLEFPGDILLQGDGRRLAHFRSLFRFTKC